MGDQQDNQQDPANILPELQVPSGGNDGDQGSAQSSSVPDDQTMPTDRALVVTPEDAADSDLIEKEWVIKAKQIVEHTAADPFLQQEEISKMKTDYMKKRYNKDIGSA